MANMAQPPRRTVAKGGMSVAENEYDDVPIWKMLTLGLLALLALPILLIMLPLAYLFTAVTGR